MSVNEQFSRLVSSLKLMKIQTIETHSTRISDINPGQAELSYNLKQLLGEGDPLYVDSGLMVFRVRFEMQCRSGDTDVCLMIIAFAVFFEVSDKPLFDELWASEELKIPFINQQLKKTLWPYVRQFVSESMTRLEIPAITLPWLL